MTRHLPRDELERLCKVLGMLGSQYAGERASAGILADQLVRAHGLTWRQLLLSPPTSAPAPALSVREKIALCCRHLDLLTPWEREFVRSLRQFSRLSPKQLRILSQLAEQLSKGAKP